MAEQNWPDICLLSIDQISNLYYPKRCQIILSTNYAEIHHVRSSCPAHHCQYLWTTCLTHCTARHTCSHRLLPTCHHSHHLCRTEQKESTSQNMRKGIVLHVRLDHTKSVILHNNGIYLANISEFSGTQNVKFEPSTRSFYNRPDKSSHPPSVNPKPYLLLHKLPTLHLLHPLFLHNVLEVEHNIHFPIPQGKRKLTQSIPSLPFTQNPNNSITKRINLFPLPLKLQLRLRYHKTTLPACVPSRLHQDMGQEE